VLSELKTSVALGEGLMQNSASVNKVFLKKTLIVQTENVKSVQANLRIQIFFFYIFAASLGQQLKGQDFLCDRVVCNKFRVYDKALHCFRHMGG
jgi:hypothetical protein